MHKVNPYLITPVHPISVAVIGCGGTGSMVLSRLARLNEALLMSGHLGLHVTAYDGDKVSQSNIGRQGFYPSDIDQYKSTVLIERINRCFGYQWNANVSFISDFPKRNIIFVCVDSMKERLTLYSTNTRERYSLDYREKRMYVIDCGNTHASGQVIISTPTSKELRNPIDIFGADVEIQDAEQPSCALFMNLREQSLFINDTIATVAVNTLYELFSEMQIDYNGVMIDTKSMRYVKIPIQDEERAITSGSKNAIEAVS